MKKNEISKAKDNELIYEYVQSYALLTMNYNEGKATKQKQAHCNDLEKELVKRGLLTEENVKNLNM